MEIDDKIAGKLNIAMNGKSSAVSAIESLGHRLKAWVDVVCGKVRPGASKVIQSDK